MAKETPDVAPRTIGDHKVIPVRVNGKPMMMALSEFAELTGNPVASERNNTVQLSTWQDVTHAAKVTEAEETGGAKAAALGAASGITWGIGPVAALAAAEALGGKELKRNVAEEMAVLREAHGGKALLFELAAAMGPQALEMIGARLGRKAAGAAAGAAASAPVAPAAGGGAAGLLPAAPGKVSAAQGTARAGAGGSTLGGVRAASAQPLEGELLSSRVAQNAMRGPMAEGEIVSEARQLPAARGLARGAEEGSFEAGPRALQEPPLEGEVLARPPELARGGANELPFAETRPGASPFEATLPALERGASGEGGILAQMRGVTPAAYEKVGVSAGGRAAEGELADNLGARAAEDVVSESPDLGFFSYPKEARAAIRGGKVKPNAAELRADLAEFEREMVGQPGFENSRKALLKDLSDQSKLEAEFLDARGAERVAILKNAEEAGGSQAGFKTPKAGGNLVDANEGLAARLREAAMGPEGLIPSVEGRALNEAVGTLRGGKVGGSTIGEMRDAAIKSGMRGPEGQIEAALDVRGDWLKATAHDLTPEQIARNAERVEGPAFQKEAADVKGAYLNKGLSDDPEMQARIQEILAQIEGKEAAKKAIVPGGPGGMSGPPPGDFASPNSLPPGAPGLPPAAGAGGSGGALPPTGGTGLAATGGSLPPPGGAGPGGAALSPAGQTVLAAMQTATQAGANPLQAAHAVAKAQQQTMVQGMAKAAGVLPSALRADLGQAFIQGAASQIENDLVADRPVAVGAAVANGLAGVALAGASARAFSRVGGLGHTPAGGPNVQTAGGLSGTQEKLQKFIRNAAFQQLRPAASTIKSARRLGVIDDIGEQLLSDVPRMMGKKSLASMTPDEMLEGVTKLIERNGDAMGDILGVGNKLVQQGKARVEPAIKLYNSLEMMAQDAEKMVGIGDKIAEQIRVGRDHWAKAMGLRNSMGQMTATAATKPTDLRKLKDLANNWAKPLVYLGEASPEFRIDPAKRAFAAAREMIETELGDQAESVFAQIGKPGMADKYAFIKQQYQASRFIAEMAEREAIANAKSNGTINKMANVIQGVVFGTAVMGGAGLETLFAGSARTVGQLFRENANRWAIAAAEKLAGGVAVSAERRVLQNALEKGFQDFIDVDLSQAQKAAVKLPNAAQTAQMAVNVQNLANNPTALNNAAVQTAQNMGSVSPQMAQQVQDSFKEGVRTLAGFIPTAYQRMKYSDSTPEFDPYELKKFAIALRAVTDPGSVAQDLARGQLSPTAWEALQKANPELAINMQDQLRASIALARATKGKKFHWTPQKETAMAGILKDADLPSLKPKTIKLNQATYMQLSGEGSGGAPAAGGGAGPMAGGQGAAARMGGASFAKAYATGPQKTAFGGF